MGTVVSQATVKAFVLAEAQTQINFCRARFKLPDSWCPEVKTTFSENITVSRGGMRGGKEFIKLALVKYLYPVNGFTEYRSFEGDSRIGSFCTPDWRVCVKALIAHELAHAVQFSLPFSANLTKNEARSVRFGELGKFDSGHGDFFRRIYETLREKFVNSHLIPSDRGITPPVNVSSEQIQSRTGKHPVIGRAFNHKTFGPCTMVDYVTKARVYPFVFATKNGRLYKTSQRMLMNFSDLPTTVLRAK